MDQLSKAIWQDDIKEVDRLCNFFKETGQSLDDWDCRGNTPLHLAIMLGRVEVVKSLLRSGCSCFTVNAKDDSILLEVIKLGNREIMAAVIQAWQQENLKNMPRDYLFNEVGDFHMQVEVKLKSNVPAFARLCPSETVNIYKSSQAIRIDYTIAKIKGLKLRRSKMSMLVQPDEIFLIDHKLKVIEQVTTSKSLSHDMIQNYMVDGYLKNEMPLKQFVLTPKNSSKKLQKGQFETTIYNLSNMGWIQHYVVPVASRDSFVDCDDSCLESNQVPDVEPAESLEFLEALSNMADRRLSEETLRDDASIYPQKSIYPQQEVRQRHLADFEPVSLQSTEEGYFGDLNKRILMGRDCHSSSSTFVKNEPAYVYMAKQFPIDIKKLAPFIAWLIDSSCAPIELQEFVSQVEGFPVRVEIPLLPLVKLKVSVVKMTQSSSGIDFSVPKDYKNGSILPFIEM